MNIAENNDKHNVAKFISSSKHRRGILAALRRNESTPSNLSDRLSVDIAQVSRSLKELKEKGLVRCINPDAKKGRIYKITDKAQKVLPLIPIQRQEDYINRIIEKLDKENLPYGKNVKFQGGVTEFNPDLVVFNGHEPEIAIEIKSGRNIKGKRREGSNSQENLYSLFQENLYSLAFKIQDTLKEKKKIKTVLAFYGIEREEVPEKTMNRLDKLLEESYFDYVYFEDEINKIIETA